MMISHIYISSTKSYELNILGVFGKDHSENRKTLHRDKGFRTRFRPISFILSPKPQYV